MIEFNITIVYQFINIIVLLILLNFLLFKPVLKALSKREQVVSSLTEGAEGAKEDIKDAGKKYEEVVKEKKKPILDNRDSVISDARAAATKTIEKARSELTDELTRVKSEIDAEGVKAYDSLKTDAEKLSREVAEKVLKRSL